MLADLARRFSATESLHGDTGDSADTNMLGRATALTRQEAYLRAWRQRDRSEEERPSDHADTRPDDAELDPDKEAAEEDERLAEMMEAHPEYHKYFDDPSLLDDEGCTEEGVNPFAHMSMHGIVENQLDEGEPPQVRDCLERLLATGLSRHEAIHRIATAVSNMIFEVMSQNREVDQDKYLNDLETIARDAETGTT
jgi:hypothetical protein